MSLRSMIMAAHSKANTVRIVNWVGNDQRRFDALIHLLLHDEELAVQRVSWPLSYIVTEHPLLIKKHLGRLLKYVQQPGLHPAVKRNMVRSLQAIEIPRRYHGPVMNLCFEYILSPAEKPAVKAFSLSVLRQLSQQYPEIIPEIQTIIQDRWETESPAFRARATCFLKGSASYRS